MKRLSQYFFKKSTGAEEGKQPSSDAKSNKAPAAAAEHKVPLQGIRLSHLKTIAVEPTFSCYDVCSKIVLPSTKESRASYADWLKQTGKAEHVKDKADVFISYAWSYKFADLLNAISDAKINDDPFVWLDMFIVNQHDAVDAAYDFSGWAMTFSKALNDIGFAVLVIMDWVNPIPLTRSWCVFEYTTVIQSELKYHVQMSNKDKQDFKETIRAGNTDVGFYKGWFGLRDLANATAFKDSDRLSINEYLANVGYLKVNDAIMKPLKQWLVESTKEAEADCGPNSEEKGNVFFVKACLYESLGEYREAAKFYEEAVKVYEAFAGHRNTNHVARSLNNNAIILQNFGENEKAIKMLEESAAINEALFGVGDELAGNLNNLAGAYSKIGDNEKARQLYERALDIRLKLFGEENETVATGQENLAVILEKFNELEKSKKLKLKALATKKKLLGEGSPQVAMSLSNLGVLYEALNDLRGAEELYKQSVAIRRRALGEDHPELAMGYNNYGGLLLRLGKPEEGAEQLENAVRIFKISNGPDTFETGNAYWWLSTAYESAGNVKKANEAGKEAYRAFKIALGEDDSRTQMLKEKYAK